MWKPEVKTLKLGGHQRKVFFKFNYMNSKLGIKKLWSTFLINTRAHRVPILYCLKVGNDCGEPDSLN